jgi:hypothetical protein
MLMRRTQALLGTADNLALIFPAPFFAKSLGEGAVPVVRSDKLPQRSELPQLRCFLPIKVRWRREIPRSLLSFSKI